MPVYKSIIDLVGNTPMVRLNKISKDVSAEIIVKCEFFNPLSSIKDRIGRAMIEAAERDGNINPDTIIIEPTSGNTGVALAFVCAVRGYRLILTMPDSMSIERRKLLVALGAELVLTPGGQGMPGAISKAEELAKEHKNSFMPRQFSNPANPEAHFITTAEEIWKDCNGNIDIFVAGVGTGGTVSGIGKFLKQKNPGIKIYAVEPDVSAVISGDKAGPHKIQGIGAGFIPENLNKDILDGVVGVSSDQAGETSRMLARQEGLLCGISSGANVFAALQLAGKLENQGKRIVTVLCDTGERYLSTWLWEDNPV